VAQLAWCPQIEWDGHLLRLSLPCRPWVPISRGVGGSEVSAAGVPAAYEIRRDRIQRITLRVYEDEWEQVEQWLEWAQRTALPFRWRFDQDDPSTAVTCYLEAPAMGDPIEPQRSADFGSVLEITIDLRYTEVYRPLYYSGARDPTPDLPDLLWRWRAGWAGGSFSRSSSAWYIGADGLLRQAAAGVPRIEWYDLDGDGVRETPALRLEPSRTNLLLDSCNLPASGSPWGGTSNFTVTPAASIFAGQTAWRHQNLGQTTFAGRSQVVGTLTGQPETVSVVVENVDATTTAVSLFDDTAAAHVCRVQLAWATGAATVVAGSGTARATRLASAGPNGGPVYRITVTGTGTAGNQRRIVVYPSGTSQNTQTAIVHHVQHEVGAVATSPIVTTTAPVTRAADVLTFPWPHAPQAMTGYLRFVELGAVVTTSANVTLFRLGTNPQGWIVVERIGNDSRYRCSYRRDDSSTTVAIVLPTSPVPAIGDRVELLWRLYADGSVQIEQSINGGAPVVAARSSAIGLPAAWSGQILRLSGVPNGSDAEAPAAWRDALICKGTDITWDEVRALVGA